MQRGLTGWHHRESGIYNERVGTRGLYRIQRGSRDGVGSGKNPDVGVKTWAAVRPLWLASCVTLTSDSDSWASGSSLA